MRRISVVVAVVVVVALGCGDDAGPSEAGDETSTESGSGDGDGDPGDGDGAPGDGDGAPGDGDGDGAPGDGDGDGDGAPGDGDGAPGDGDGDGEPGECDPAAFLGFGLAEDGWGVGDFCDSVYVCTDPSGAEALMGLIDVACMPDRPGCEAGEVQCRLPLIAEVTPETYADACTALTVPGIDAVWCVVWGP